MSSQHHRRDVGSYQAAKMRAAGGMSSSAEVATLQASIGNRPASDFNKNLSYQVIAFTSSLQSNFSDISPPSPLAQKR